MFLSKKNLISFSKRVIAVPEEKISVNLKSVNDAAKKTVSDILTNDFSQLSTDPKKMTEGQEIREKMWAKDSEFKQSLFILSHLKTNLQILEQIPNTTTNTTTIQNKIKASCKTLITALMLHIKEHESTIRLEIDKLTTGFTKKELKNAIDDIKKMSVYLENNSNDATLKDWMDQLLGIDTNTAVNGIPAPPPPSETKKAAQHKDDGSTIHKPPPPDPKGFVSPTEQLQAINAAPKRVVILTGFLGSGKTETLKAHTNTYKKSSFQIQNEGGGMQDALSAHNDLNYQCTVFHQYSDDAKLNKEQQTREWNAYLSEMEKAIKQEIPEKELSQVSADQKAVPNVYVISGGCICCGLEAQEELDMVLDQIQEGKYPNEDDIDDVIIEVTGAGVGKEVIEQVVSKARSNVTVWDMITLINPDDPEWGQLIDSKKASNLEQTLENPSELTVHMDQLEGYRWFINKRAGTKETKVDGIKELIKIKNDDVDDSQIVEASIHDEHKSKTIQSLFHPSKTEPLIDFRSIEDTVGDSEMDEMRLSVHNIEIPPLNTLQLNTLIKFMSEKKAKRFKGSLKINHDGKTPLPNNVQLGPEGEYSIKLDVTGNKLFIEILKSPSIITVTSWN
ncbi:hypothetical protein DID77_02540 [Candidatus Marinamargulisbacteria bacterium SCGC AG-439-L15]|nr:hypothetical protein DID77_02540 [Candidatus Marinamargulisbacteria bacterium SCGC AG-439-L15]